MAFRQICKLCAAMAICTVALTAQKISFDSPSAYLIAGSSVVTADFNGDGRLGLAVTDYYANTVSIFFGNGDGTFSLRETYPVGTGPFDLLTGDFNGDGKLDLAVANTSSFSVLPGNGNGTFQAAVTTAVEEPPGAFVSGQFKSDGYLDLAFTSGLYVYILPGNGDGSFSPAVSYELMQYPTSLAVGDFNKDGHPDLVATDIGGEDHSGQDIAVLLGNGDGTFQKPLYRGAGNSPNFVAVGDFNRDGTLDLAVTDLTSPGALLILLGNGDGSFQSPVGYDVGPYPGAIYVADFNADGKVDLAVTGSIGTLLFLGNGDGTFQLRDLSRVTGTLAVGDYNRDGNKDLAVANGSLTVLLGDGRGDFQSLNTYPTGSSTEYYPIPGDFNGDGYLDLALIDSHFGNVGIMLGDSTGKLAAPVKYPVGKVAGGGVAADFNGDGSLDLAVGVIGSNGGSVSVLLGNGNGTFRAPSTYECGASSRSDLNSVIGAADFNSDGKLDVAVLKSGYGVCLLFGNGDGTFRTGAQTPVNAPQLLSAAIGDFNYDGKPDIAITSQQAGAVFVLLGNGDGTFQSPVAYSVGLYPQTVAVGNFTGTGVQDLAVVNLGDTSSTVSILMGNGDGTFSPTVDYGVGSGASSLVIGDFNRDGHQDLAIPNDGSSALVVLAGNGDGTFQLSTSYELATPASGYELAGGDFNGDGKLDLAVVNLGEPYISILLNTTR